MHDNNRRREIIDAAAHVFERKGYDATSTQDIAEAVGILKGSLYYYIESKEDLLFTVIKEAYDAALAAVEELELRDGDALGMIGALVRKHVEVFAATRVQTSVFFRDFRALSPERQKVIREAGEVYSGFLRSQIRRGQGEGVIRPDLNPRLCAIGIIGMLNAMSFWYRPDGAASPSEIGEEFSRLVIGGLASSGVDGEQTNPTPGSGLR